MLRMLCRCVCDGVRLAQWVTRWVVGLVWLGKCPESSVHIKVSVSSLCVVLRAVLPTPWCFVVRSFCFGFAVLLPLFYRFLVLFLALFMCMRVSVFVSPIGSQYTHTHGHTTSKTFM